MIEIREARLEDVPAYALGRNVDEFHTSDQAPTFWPEEVLRNCISKEDVRLLVATSNQKVVGFIITNLNRSLRKAEIENIFVHPDFRHKGIGSSLANQVVEFAKSNQYQFISTLTPPDDLAAIKNTKELASRRGRYSCGLIGYRLHIQSLPTEASILQSADPSLFSHINV